MIPLTLAAPLMLFDGAPAVATHTELFVHADGETAWYTLHRQYDQSGHASLELRLDEVTYHRVEVVGAELSTETWPRAATAAPRELPPSASVDLGPSTGPLSVEVVWSRSYDTRAGVRTLQLPLGLGPDPAPWEVPGTFSLTVEIAGGLPITDVQLAGLPLEVVPRPWGAIVESYGDVPSSPPVLSWTTELTEPRVAFVHRGDEQELVMEVGQLSPEYPIPREVEFVVQRGHDDIGMTMAMIEEVADGLGPGESLNVRDLRTGARAMTRSGVPDAATFRQIAAWLEEPPTHPGHGVGGLRAALARVSDDTIKVVVLVSDGRQEWADRLGFGWHGGFIGYWSGMEPDAPLDFSRARVFAVPLGDDPNLGWLRSTTLKSRGAVVHDPDALAMTIEGLAVHDVDAHSSSGVQRLPDLWTGRPQRWARSHEVTEVTGWIGVDEPWAAVPTAVVAPPCPPPHDRSADLVLNDYDGSPVELRHGSPPRRQGRPPGISNVRSLLHMEF